MSFNASLVKIGAAFNFSTTRTGLLFTRTKRKYSTGSVNVVREGWRSGPEHKNKMQEVGSRVGVTSCELAKSPPKSCQKFVGAANRHMLDNAVGCKGCKRVIMPVSKSWLKSMPARKKFEEIKCATTQNLLVIICRGDIPRLFSPADS